MKKALMALAAVAVISTACGSTDTSPEPTSGGVSYEVTADDVVDATAPSVVDTFCTLYDEIGDYTAALGAFADGYGTSQNPSAQEVFDEMLSRC